MLESLKSSRLAMAVLAGFLICGFAVVYWSFGSTLKSDWSEELPSPDGKYRIHLKGKTDAAIRWYYPHGDHKVAYTLLRDGKVILENEPLYSGDQYDDLFPDLYPEHEWVSNSTIRFGKKAPPDKNVLDRLIVTNKGQRVIDVFRLNFGFDLFLTFHVAPQTRLELSAKSQTDKQSDRSGMSFFRADW